MADGPSTGDANELLLLGASADAAVQPISAPRQAARAIATALFYATTGVNLGAGLPSDDAEMRWSEALRARPTPAAYVQWLLALWLERYIIEGVGDEAYADAFTDDAATAFDITNDEGSRLPARTAMTRSDRTKLWESRSFQARVEAGAVLPTLWQLLYYSAHWFAALAGRYLPARADGAPTLQHRRMWELIAAAGGHTPLPSDDVLRGAPRVLAQLAPGCVLCVTTAAGQEESAPDAFAAAFGLTQLIPSAARRGRATEFTAPCLHNVACGGVDGDAGARAVVIPAAAVLPGGSDLFSTSLASTLLLLQDAGRVHTLLVPFSAARGVSSLSLITTFRKQLRAVLGDADASAFAASAQGHMATLCAPPPMAPAVAARGIRLPSGLLPEGVFGDHVRSLATPPSEAANAVARALAFDASTGLLWAHRGVAAGGGVVAVARLIGTRLESAGMLAGAMPPGARRIAVLTVRISHIALLAVAAAGTLQQKRALKHLLDVCNTTSNARAACSLLPSCGVRDVLPSFRATLFLKVADARDDVSAVAAAKALNASDGTCGALFSCGGLPLYALRRAALTPDGSTVRGELWGVVNVPPPGTRSHDDDLSEDKEEDCGEEEEALRHATVRTYGTLSCTLARPVSVAEISMSTVSAHSLDAHSVLVTYGIAPAELAGVLTRFACA